MNIVPTMIQQDESVNGKQLFLNPPEHDTLDT